MMRRRIYGYLAVACIILMLFTSTANALTAGDQTRHFNIVYGSGLEPSDGKSLGQTLENAYDLINGYYGTLPDQVKVLVVGQAAMDEIGEHVEAFSAWNPKSSSIVLREETLDKQPSLDVIVRHELSHLGINNILCKKDSTEFQWMQEGLCMVLSQEPLSDKKVSKYIMTQGFLSPPEIADAVKNEKYNITRDGYLQSWSLIDYMITEFGAQRVIDMLRVPDSNFDAAFKQNTGIDFDTFYRQWEDHVKDAATDVHRPMIPVFGHMFFGSMLVNYADS
jgi:hypothetical protein